MSNVFSDSEQSESGEDFSVSEDEWTPGKADDDVSDDDGSEDDAEDQTELDESSVIQKDTKKKTKKGKTPKRKPLSTLRSKLYRKYKPPPKTLNTSIKKPLPPKIANILSNSRFEKTKMLPSTSQMATAATYESESESSDDNGLVAPDDLDFNSIAADAAATSTANLNKEIAPAFDCNAGMRLSDSSENEDDVDVDTAEHSAVTKSAQKKSIIEKINAKSSAGVREFSDFQTFTKNIDAAKAHMKKLETKQTTSTDETDITKLLSLGEGPSNNAVENHKSLNRKRKKNEHDSDDSDWENVASDHDDGGTSGRPKHDIQITVGTEITRGMSREKKKALDLEACLKRRLNRDIKENQVFLHKCSFLGWMAHGNYVNRIVNNSSLMKMCLKHFPSKDAYPNGDTELKYFVSFTKWFHTFFELKSKQMHCNFRPLPPKLNSLALQIRAKQAISKHDYVLIYATMLRAIGVQCRVVINMPVAPLRPRQDDLFVVSSKPKVDEKELQKIEKKETESNSEIHSPKKLKLDSKSKGVSKVDDESSKKSKEAKPKTLTVKLKEKVETEKKANEMKPPTLVKKLKVSADRMSDSFIERHTGEPSKKPSKPLKKSSEPLKKSSEPLKKSSEPLKKSSEPSKKPSESIEATKPGAKSKIKSTAIKGKAELNSSNVTAISKKSSDPPLFSNKNKNTHDKAQPEMNKAAAVPSSSHTYSPRKTRSRMQRDTNAATTSAQVNGKHHSKTEEKSGRAKSRLCLKVPQLDGASDELRSKSTAKKTKVTAKKSHKNHSDSDSDFAPTPPKRVRSKATSAHFEQMKKPKPKALQAVKRIDLRVCSTDDDDDDEAKTMKTTKVTAIDTWIEAYNEKDKKWVVIDPVNNKVNALDHIRKLASKPIVYAFAWNNDNSMRDVTPRYCNNFHTSTRKQRADPLWLEMALRRYKERKNPRTIIEDVEFSKMHMDTPLPTSISEFKNHPLYALERHLLKFQAIYPPNAMTLGYIRKEPVFARECVHTLHSREIWVKQARTVKMDEIPYKIVKARPKWNRALNEMEEAKPLEIFGFWQTQPYEPPVAENGIVPRNPYGNVELFKPEMLPIGTRHIQLPSLNRTCKKMNVDCAQAVIGFDFHSGSSHPTFDGFVVCEEFADQVVAQWYADQEEVEEKEQKKYEARVYGNWKKLIKGLFIRERLKRKYDFGKDKAK